MDWYRGEAGADTAERFVDALEVALVHIGEYPGSGSSRYAAELALPGLRSWRLYSFPYVVFYAQRSDGVDVWRVLHAHRDIPAWMSEPADPPPDDAP